jgi:hypothetical protein
MITPFPSKAGMLCKVFVGERSGGHAEGFASIARRYRGKPGFGWAPGFNSL